MDLENESLELNGTIQAVRYTNEENGYTVLRVVDENGELQTVVGCIPNAAPGEAITATGTWTAHAVYGKQFKADFFQRMLPTSAQGIFDYLAGGAIKGIGPATASLIVNAYGEKSLFYIENEPEKIAELKGISLTKAKEYSAIYRQQTIIRRLMEFICSFSVRPIFALKLYRYFGEEAMDVLRKNPYILSAAFIGGTFSEADMIAREIGFDDDSPERVKAGITFELVFNLNSGHCFIPESSLVDASAKLLSVEPEKVSECIIELAEEGELIREEVKGLATCYLPELYEAETYIAQRLAGMKRVSSKNRMNTERLIKEIEEKNAVTYAAAQRATLDKAVEEQVLIITGGPGTGKTTTVRAILDMFEIAGIKALLTAPTGRAAKRMTELTGREATTVHRLLGAQYADDGYKVVFAKNESDTLVCDAVILDESSMVDVLLLASLLKAMPDSAKLIMVGDVDQLPPVGPGNAFKSIIASGVFCTVKLTEIFRQSADSLIVKNAHLINEGKYPNFGANTADFFRLKRLEAASSVETITELCAVRLPNRMKIPVEDIQVLTPTKKGEMGTMNLNRELQKVLNPPSEEKHERPFGDSVFREGDRVMQVRNNYDVVWHDDNLSVAGSGIYNGDIGYIRRIDFFSETVEIDFDGRIAQYMFSMLNELEHAWAITVHKSQGCEFKAVVLALSSSASRLLTRSILYTGVTRAKDLLILVGDESVAIKMIDNFKVSGRYTYLKYRLLCSSGRI